MFKIMFGFSWQKTINAFLFIIVLCTSVYCSDEQGQALEDYKKKYPDKLPLVLGIPGFRVPGVTIPQEKHFGDLEELLAKHDIPYYCITYDSDDYPLPAVADLASDNYSIAVTRVTPSIIRVIKLERERRRKNNLPPVEDVILFMYSQGTVVSYGFVRKLHYFRRTFQEYKKLFCCEHEAILNDPVFFGVH